MTEGNGNHVSAGGHTAYFVLSAGALVVTLALGDALTLVLSGKDNGVASPKPSYSVWSTASATTSPRASNFAPCLRVKLPEGCLRITDQLG